MKIAIVKASQLGDNWSAEYHVNAQEGKKPYILKDYELIPADNLSRYLLQKAIYLKPEDADKLNAAGRSVLENIKKWNDLLKIQP